MIQFCGIVRVWYHFRFGFARVQNIGDGINDELRIYTVKTTWILACPRFGAIDSWQTFDYIFGLVDKYFDDVAISPNIESQCECKLKFKTSIIDNQKGNDWFQSCSSFHLLEWRKTP